MRRETVAFVASALSACTAVTKVTVTPGELQALADMGPNEERKFSAIDEDDTMVAKGDDDVRVLVTPIGLPGRGRTPPVQQEPWGKLYSLHWGSSVTLTPTVAGSSDTAISTSVLATEVTGGELRMNRYSGTRTIVLVACIVGAIVTLGLGVLIAGAAHAGGG